MSHSLVATTEHMKKEKLNQFYNTGRMIMINGEMILVPKGTIYNYVIKDLAITMAQMNKKDAIKERLLKKLKEKKSL